MRKSANDYIPGLTNGNATNRYYRVEPKECSFLKWNTDETVNTRNTRNERYYSAQNIKPYSFHGNQTC